MFLGFVQDIIRPSPPTAARPSAIKVSLVFQPTAPMSENISLRCVITDVLATFFF